MSNRDNENNVHQEPEDSDDVITLGSVVKDISKSNPDFATLSPDSQENIVNGISSVVRRVYIRKYSGPLPHPEVLEGYENVVPGSAQQIINNMIKESEHRRKMEEKALDNAALFTKSGQKKGFILAVLGILSGLAIIYFTAQIENSAASITGVLSGTLISGSSLATIILRFIDVGQRKNNEQYESDKDDE